MPVDGLGRNARTVVFDDDARRLARLLVVIVTLMTGGLSASSQASMALSTSSLTMTRGHL